MNSKSVQNVHLPRSAYLSLLACDEHGIDPELLNQCFIFSLSQVTKS